MKKSSPNLKRPKSVHRVQLPTMPKTDQTYQNCEQEDFGQHILLPDPLRGRAFFVHQLNTLELEQERIVEHFAHKLRDGI